MASLNGLLFHVGMLGFVSGLDGSGRIQVLDRMFGFGLTFVPPSPLLIDKDPHTQSSRILVEPHLIDAEFRKAWMPFFSRVRAIGHSLRRAGHQSVTSPCLSRSGCWWSCWDWCGQLRWRSSCLTFLRYL